MKLFTSTKRFWLAVLFVFSGVCYIPQGIGEALLTIIIGVAFIIPELIYYFTDGAKVWGQWSDVESSKAQQDRKERAETGELTPLSFDKRGKVGFFVGGSGKKYRTTLKGCTCPDFKKRKAPCKHMYYLAGELGEE
jgi:hypothetical protein